MEKSIFNKKLILAVLTIFIFVCAVQTIQPAASAKLKLFDKGSIKKFDSADKRYFIYEWKSYKKKNYVLVKDKTYWVGSTQKTPHKYIITKSGKNRLKIQDIFGVEKNTFYKKTKLSPYRFYKKYFNKGNIGFSNILYPPALTQFDQGSKTYTDTKTSTLMSFTWKAYKKNNNYVVIKGTYYSYLYQRSYPITYYLQKVSSSKIRTKTLYQGKTITEYFNTKLSAVQYYWKHRP